MAFALVGLGAGHATTITGAEAVAAVREDRAADVEAPEQHRRRADRHQSDHQQAGHQQAASSGAPGAWFSIIASASPTLVPRPAPIRGWWRNGRGS